MNPETGLPLLSIVVPVFSEASNIEPLIEAINESLFIIKTEFELIFVDDGSLDNTWEKIAHCSSLSQNIRGVRFSRNFGKEYAIYAGLALARGDAVITIDGDLQHPPEMIPVMYDLWKNKGFDIVDAIKRTRQKETVLGKLSANLFYKTFFQLSGLEISNATDFKLLDRRVVDVLLQLKETNRFYRGLTSWIGFTHAAIEIKIADRLLGQTKWSFSKLLLYAFNNLLDYSIRPLALIGFMGVAFFTLSIVIAAISIIRMFSGTSLEGFPTVIFLQLLIGGIIIAAICLVGIYIGKLINEVKQRPHYIIKDQVNFTDPIKD